MELLLVIFFIASFISMIVTTTIYTYFNEDDEIVLAAHSSVILFLTIGMITELLTIHSTIELDTMLKSNSILFHFVTDKYKLKRQTKKKMK